MGFKLISKNGDFLPILHRIQHEGKDVVAYLPESLDKMYVDILPIVHSHTELSIQANDVIIFDMVGAGGAAEELKHKGYTVIGGGSINDRLELNRTYGEEIAKSTGLLVPNSVVFGDFVEARDFVRIHPNRYVFKPDGNLDTSLTYVSSSTDDMIEELYILEEQCPSGTVFTLQEFMDGIEMSTEAWFNGEKFILPVNSTMEEKKFLTGNLGQNTGCMGNVVWVWPDDISEYLLDTMFRPMEPLLQKGTYLGPLDINAIWTPQGPHFLEFTARFGYDAIQAYTRLVEQPLSDFFESLPGTERMEVNQDMYAAAVRVSVPPYPVEADVPEVSVHIPEEYVDNIYLSDVYPTGNQSAGRKVFRCAGQDGYILSVASNGKRLDTTMAEIYHIIDEIEARGIQYRLDIGDRVKVERMEILRYLRRLIASGYA